MKVRAIRGATTVEKNEREEIIKQTKELLLRIIKENNIDKRDIISIIFSMTQDLDKGFPAVAARQLGLTDVALMCVNEAKVDRDIKKCIRILMNINTDKENFEMRYVYMRDAIRLRPDLLKKVNIAIDGPAGAGKSTVADAVAKALSIIHIDTGAMYRTVAYEAMRKNYDISSEGDMSRLMDNISIKQEYIDGIQKMYLGDEDITHKIRTPEISNGASDVAKLGCVRTKLTEIQRDWAKSESVVMDGRDIGSCVLPNADLKIFLTASVEERTNRRYKDLLDKGMKDVKIEDVMKDIIARDKNDSERKISPLMMADDAILLDTTGMNIDMVVDNILKLVGNLM